jgi:hypothetical protein
LSELWAGPRRACCFDERTHNSIFHTSHLAAPLAERCRALENEKNRAVRCAAIGEINRRKKERPEK